MEKPVKTIMPFEFNIKSSLLLVFFIHGVVFSSLLGFKAKRDGSPSSFWLSVFILLCVMYITPFMLGYAGWYGEMPYREILFYVPFQQVLLLPPVLFFYTKSLLDQSFVFTRKEALHFIPAGIYLAYTLVIAVTDKVVLEYNYFYLDGRDKDFAVWYQVAGFVSLVVYLVWSLIIYRLYRRISYQTISFADSVTFRWVRYFLIALLTLLILRGAFFIINPEWASFGRKFWYYLSFSVLFYYISISGYLNSLQTVISLASDDQSGARSSLLHQPAKTNAALAIKETGDENPLIPDLAGWTEKIDVLMKDEKLFEMPSLTISDVAGRLKWPSKKVSQAINQGLGMNFNDYVNAHRIRLVISKFESGEQTLQTLMGIALDCGFNSKSTFNRAFKKHTSLSPKEYLKKYGHK